MDNNKTKKITKETRRQKIMLCISLIAGGYLLYFGMQNKNWIYYCAVASAYIFTKAVGFGIKIHKNNKLIASLK